MLHRSEIEQALRDYILLELHPDLQLYLKGDELHHPLVYLEGGVHPRVYPRINKHFRYKKEKLQQDFAPNQWQAYCPHLPAWERLRKFITEELARPDFPTRDPAYYEFLGQIWTDPEVLFATSSFLELMLGLMGDLPLSEHVHYLMTSPEQQKLADLPESFVLFRGHAVPLLQGISWTLKLDVALQYAVGNPLQSSISVGIAQQSEVIAFIDRWEEDEVIIPAHAVVDIETYMLVETHYSDESANKSLLG